MKKVDRDPFTRFTREVQKEVIDKDTNEVLASSTEREGITPKEPLYVKLYFADLAYLNELPRWTTGILYELLKLMDYEGRIILNAGLKREIATRLNTTVQNIENSITKFNKKKILIRKDTGIYLANPWLFGRGEWKEIRQIRLSVGYNLDGTRELRAEIEREEDTNKKEGFIMEPTL